ncbi:MAG: arsenate reductase ArsC [Pseudomonadota bacterium]
MTKSRVLFVCVHNSARSQMAQAYLERLAGERFEVQSAGFEPGPINPLVVEVMREEGLDLSQKKAQSVFELFKQGKIFKYVITVCEASREQECPIFPGVTNRLHLPFPDPAQLAGSLEQRLEGTRQIRNQIKRAVEDLASQLV